MESASQGLQQALVCCRIALIRMTVCVSALFCLLQTALIAQMQLPAAGWTSFSAGAIVSPSASMNAQVGGLGAFFVAPVVPLLVSPADASINQAQTLDLVWNDPHGAVMSEWQLSKDESFAALITSGTTAATSVAVESLDPASVYHWRVRTVHTGGYSPWAKASFSTASGPSLAIPLLLQPADKATCLPLPISVTWRRIAPAVSYDIRVSISPDFSTTSFSASLADTTTTIGEGALAANSVYFVSVRAVTPTLQSAWSAPHEFSTRGISTPPTLTSPLNGATDVALRPTLSWVGLVGDNTAYDIQIGTTNPPLGENQAPEQFEGQTQTTTWITSSNLLPNTQYHWRVRSIVCGDTSVWVGGVFVTGNGEQPPCLVCSTVDFGDVLVNSKRRREVRCVNMSNDVLQLGLPASSNPLFTLYYPFDADFTTSPGYLLRSNDTLVMIVDVRPRVAGLVEAEITVPVTSRGASACAAALATVRVNSVAFAQRNSAIVIERRDGGGEVAPGERVPFDIRLASTKEELNADDFDSLVIRMVYDPRAFRVEAGSFVAVTRTGGVGFQISRMEQSRTAPVEYLQLVVHQPSIDAEGLLGSFSMLAKLADVDSTRIIVSEVRWAHSDGAAPIQAESVTEDDFTLRVNICREGKPRLVGRRSVTSASVLNIAPNPTSDVVRISLHSQARIQRVELINIIGQQWPLLLNSTSKQNNGTEAEVYEGSVHQMAAGQYTVLVTLDSGEVLTRALYVGKE
jgi:hypothetical protein